MLYPLSWICFVSIWSDKIFNFNTKRIRIRICFVVTLLTDMQNASWCVFKTNNQEFSNVKLNIEIWVPLIFFYKKSIIIIFLFLKWKIHRTAINEANFHAKCRFTTNFNWLQKHINRCTHTYNKHNTDSNGTKM